MLKNLTGNQLKNRLKVSMMQDKDPRTQFITDFILLHVNNDKCCVEVSRLSVKSWKQNDTETLTSDSVFR